MSGVCKVVCSEEGQILLLVWIVWRSWTKQEDLHQCSTQEPVVSESNRGNRTRVAFRQLCSFYWVSFCGRVGSRSFVGLTKLTNYTRFCITHPLARSIPPELGALSKVQTLRLKDNNLTGNIF